MKIFPFALIRTGGIDFESIKQFDSGGLEEITVATDQNKLEIKKISGEITDILYELINKTTDGASQKKLLNIKRDIFNQRKFSEQGVEIIRLTCDEKLNALVNEYQALFAKAEELKMQGEELYKMEHERIRNLLKKFALNDHLRKGLLLSSQVIYESLAGYMNKGAETSNKKIANLELSLVKYLTRMGAKTSPFSTFNQLSVAEIKDHTDKSFLKIGHTDSVINSHVRINNYIFKYFKTLLTKNKDITRLFVIRKNPTIELMDEKFIFLTNFNNVESFQQVDFNPVLGLFLEKAGKDNAGISIGDLITEILDADEIEADYDGLYSYTLNLLEIGFFEFNFGISGTDPDWDIKLYELLNGLNAGSPVVKRMCGVLNHLRVSAKEYEAATAERRLLILKSAFSALKTVCLELHEAAGLPEKEREDGYKVVERSDEDDTVAKVFKQDDFTHFYFKPEQIFFEDTTLGIQSVLNKNRIEPLVSKLDKLLGALHLFDAVRVERIKMKAFFEDYYKNGGSIPMVNFYEDYYREYKLHELKMHEVKESEKAESPLHKFAAMQKAVKEYEASCQGWINRFTERLLKKCSTYTEEVDIDSLITEELSAGFETNANPYSKAAFLQLYQHKGDSDLRGVLNINVAGYGKMFSRFLHLFPHQVVDELRTHNATDDKLRLENNDASYFNANLHPPLMPYEVWVPGGNNILDAQLQIPVSELVVRQHAETGELILWNENSDKEAEIFDLCFESATRRSKLFQMLTKFSPLRQADTHPLIEAVNEKLKGTLPVTETSEGGVTLLPRIVVGEQLIIQRKKWIIAKKHLPGKNPNDSEWDFYYQVNSWRKRLKIPDEVYVTVSSMYERDKLTKEMQKVLKSEDYKPQYINFTNPLLVKLLHKLFEKVPLQLQMDEALPAPADWISINNSTYVSEFILQWYA